MASADVREELSIYTDPVTLRCGHNFCRVCIDRVLDTQDGAGVYSCPDCREEFQERPALRRNIALHNVAERLRSTQQPQEKITGICCTYCIHSPVPAVKSCLHCEASLCDNHLQVHSKGPEHVLTEPSTNLENWKCPIHKKILEYYCAEDAACICVSCSLAGKHRGHQVEILDEASEKKKDKLRNVLQKLITKRDETEEKVQSLQERRRKTQEKASEEAKRVTALFVDIRRRLDNLEKRVLSEISRQEKEVSLYSSALIQQLEIKKDELSRKMRHIEELCNMTDPLTVLQDPDTGDLRDFKKKGGDEKTNGHDGGDNNTEGHDGDDEDMGGHNRGDEDTGGHDGDDEDTGGHDGSYEDAEGDKTQDVDVDVITGMLYAGFSQIMTDLQVTTTGEGGIYGQCPTDILLDVNTVGNFLFVSDDLKTATWSGHGHPKSEVRFQDFNQVMSSSRFSSGRHYWDVEISGSCGWMVGMCYPSIDRRGGGSHIGNNNKSWGLQGGQWYNNQSSVIHESKVIPVPHQISTDRFRICLDYEAGKLSFYGLCNPIRHLHTFTTTFTEPLHAALWVYGDSIQILEGSSYEGPST